MADDPAPARARPRRALAGWLAALAGCGLLAWIARGSLPAGLVSEDGAVLGFVHRNGPFADVFDSQYGLRLVRFWRPLVTSSIGLQEAWTGTDPRFLRGFNLLCHAGSIALAAGLVLRLGASRIGAFAAAAWIASFPYQGGTTTWIVGRVDGLCLPWLLLAGWAGAAGRAWVGALACVLAAATKEIGFVAPIWFALAAFGAGRRALPAARLAVVPIVAGGLTLVVRRLAIGAWVGGYPPIGPDPGAADYLASFGAFAALAGPALWGVPVVLALGLVEPRGLRRSLPVLLAGLAAVAILLPMVARVGVAPEHRRWWLVPDAALGVALAAGLPVLAGRGAQAGRLAGALGLAALVVLRVPVARGDVVEWTEAGALCEAHVARVREALEGVPVGRDPVLDATVQRTTPSGRAYVFHWGFAERFREPFEPTPRPVWPWRTIFGREDEQRAVVSRLRSNLRWPFGETPSTVYPMPIRLFTGEREVDALHLELAWIGDEGPTAPRIVLFGEYPEQRLEFVVHTAIGHEAATWRGPRATSPTPWVDGSEMPALVLPMLQVLDSVGGVTVAETIAQVADLGQTVAYLELRAVDDARGERNRPVAASRWIRLTWDPSLKDALLPK